MASRHAFIRRAARTGFLLALGSAFLFGAGCGPSKKELARRAELERLAEEAERARQARAAAEEAERAAAEAARNARLQTLEQAAADAERRQDVEGALSSYKGLVDELSFDPSRAHGIREKALALAARSATPPDVPEEARRRAIRAQALVKARGNAGYAAAVAELEESVRIAPWWADGYYNLGLMQEGAGLQREAIRSLKLSLVGDPGGENGQDVQNKIYELEVLAEEAARLSGLAGAWYIYYPKTGKSGEARYDVTMDGPRFEARSSFGSVLRGTVRGAAIEGTITIPSLDGWDVNDCRTPEYTVPMTGKVREDGRLITFQHMWNNYTSTHWNITGLFNNTGRRQGECISVTLEGSSPNEINIAR